LDEKCLSQGVGKYIALLHNEIISIESAHQNGAKALVLLQKELKNFFAFHQIFTSTSYSLHI
jgi:hypothetical protein